MATRIKHPDGGFLDYEVSPNGLWLHLRDTRKINGTRRNRNAVVQQCGRLGWRVYVTEAGKMTQHGPFTTATPFAAYELA